MGLVSQDCIGEQLPGDGDDCDELVFAMDTGKPALMASAIHLAIR